MAKEIKLLQAQAELYYGKRPEGKLSDYRGIYCGRAGGKSFILSLMADQDLVMGKNIMVFAQDYECLQQNLLNPMKEFLDDWKVPYKVTGKAGQNLLVMGRSKCYGFTYENYKKARGRTKIATQVYDEIAQAPEDIFVVTAACSRDCGFEPKTLFGSTPLQGTYWDDWVKELIRDGYPIVTHGGIYENSHVTKAEIEQMERAFKGMDEAFIRQELYGEIIDSGSKFKVFPLSCFNKTLKAPSGIPSMGVDCAGSGRDYNVFYVVDDNHIIDKYKIQQADLFTMHSIANSMINKHGVRQVSIDTTGGFGNGLMDILKLNNRLQVFGVNFGQAAYDSDSYANARAEMFFEFAKACNDGFCVTEEEVKKQMCSLTFEMTRGGKTQLVEKDVIKKILGVSPDCADALALAYYNRSRMSLVSGERNAMYKPLRIHG